MEFHFGSGSRAYQESIIIRQDSTFVSHGYLLDKKIKFATSKETWERLLNSISAYSLKDLTRLCSPTHRRDSDGAFFSGLTISTNLKQYICCDFDNYDPNPILKPMLEIMLESKKVKL